MCACVCKSSLSFYSPLLTCPETLYKLTILTAIWDHLGTITPMYTCDCDDFPKSFLTSYSHFYSKNKNTVTHTHPPWNQKKLGRTPLYFFPFANFFSPSKQHVGVLCKRFSADASPCCTVCLIFFDLLYHAASLCVNPYHFFLLFLFLCFYLIFFCFSSSHSFLLLRYILHVEHRGRVFK